MRALRSDSEAAASLPDPGGEAPAISARADQATIAGAWPRSFYGAAIDGHFGPPDPVPPDPYSLRAATERLRESGRVLERTIRLFLKGARRGPDRLLTPYQRWMAHSDVTPPQLAGVAAEVAGLAVRPLVSVLLPLRDASEEAVRASVESVREQIYPAWELCIVDDASDAPHVRPVIATLSAGDERIRTRFAAQAGGPSAALNDALALASGEWALRLDAGDVLRPHALAEIVFEAQRDADAALIYADEDRIAANGERDDPWFKPGFSRELLRSQNYFGHMVAWRAETLRELGGWRPGFDGAEDFDLNLRLVEQAGSGTVRHLSKVLLHARAEEAPAGAEAEALRAAGLAALREHLERTGSPATAEFAPNTPFFRVRPPAPSPEPLVSIVIPARDRVELTKGCIASILDRTAYRNVEILLVDNNSVEPETQAYLAELQAEPRVRVLRYAEKFNYSAINNFAVRHARGSVLALVNNDIEAIEPDWLTEMVSWAVQDDVGCVGARLIYPDGSVQHAGVFLGIGGVAGHGHKHFPRDHPGYFHRLQLVQNVSAVTGACLVVRKSVYEEVGGLDEKDLVVALNDVDFCIKVRERGYLNVWTPYAELYHFESVSRGANDTPAKRKLFDYEMRVMTNRWGDLLRQDPYYSIHLSQGREDFSFNRG